MESPPPELEPLRDLAIRYADQARENEAEALTHAKRHRFVHVCVGLAAVCFGASAGSLGALELATLSAIAGVLAAISAGAQGFLQAPTLAKFHFGQAAAYGALARRLELVAIAPEQPTRQQIERLVDRWTEVQARSLDDLDSPSALEPRHRPGLGEHQAT